MIDNMNEILVNAMYDALPFEITVIDADDKVVSWNRHGNRLFARPDACMGMDFRECHPKKSLDLVEKIISEMKSGTRDKARFWIDLHVDKEKPHKVVIEFHALRDQNRKYLGCMECTMDIEDMLNLEGERRLLDGPGQ